MLKEVLQTEENKWKLGSTRRDRVPEMVRCRPIEFTLIFLISLNLLKKKAPGLDGCTGVSIKSLTKNNTNPIQNLSGNREEYNTSQTI